MTERSAGQKFESLLNAELARLLPAVFPDSTVIVEPKLGPRFRPDFVIEFGDSTTIIEAKGQMPLTERRMASVVDQLLGYQAAFQELNPDAKPPRLVLIVPEVIGPAQLDYFSSRGIHVLDLDSLSEKDPLAQGLPPGETIPKASERVSVSSETNGAALAVLLRQVTPGRGEWVHYQKLCGEILAFLFSPDLKGPISESSNASRVNRRDYVLPNYAEHGFWKYVQNRYAADYVVVDAKNFTGPVKKKEILQLANYLSSHGTGLLGLILTRSASDRSAETTRREQWALQSKLILVLNDDDLVRMLEIRDSGGRPEELIQQKIEDFRLSF